MDTDCAIIGAGSAGLECGIYLGRYLRNTIIFHGGKPRAEWIPVTHNFPGFPDGITGPNLLRRMRKQALRYGVDIRKERVHSVEGIDGDFVIKTFSGEISSRKVVFATGVYDIPPEIPDAERYKGRTIRHCPICDAYEARGRKMVMFGWGDSAARKAIWLSHYTDDLTILTTGHGGIEAISPDLRNLLDQLGIQVIDRTITAVEELGGQLGTISFDDGGKLEHVFRGYSAMGLKPNSELAANLGVEVDEQGFIKADCDQQTNVRGAYAVGDIVSGELGQLAVAIGHSATAATAVHNSMLAI